MQGMIERGLWPYRRRNASEWRDAAGYFLHEGMYRACREALRQARLLEAQARELEKTNQTQRLSMNRVVGSTAETA